MKKQLLSTSALVAAGLVATAGAASAQTAPASSPIQITVGGYMYQFLSYTDQKDRTMGSGSTGVTAKPTPVQVNNDSEIWFQGKTTLANGISVALRVELEANTESDQIDESFGIIEGAFGRIEIGSTDNSAYKMSIHAPDAALGIATAGVQSFTSNLVANPSGSSILDTPINTTLPRMGDNDSEKISYFTPRFEGFQIGLSYVPEITQDRGGIGGVRYNSNTYHSGFTAGLNFTRAFGAIDIAASAGYARFSKPDSTGAISNGTLSDPQGYLAGAQVGYAGFRVGGSYLKQKDYAAVSAGQTGAATAMSGAGWTGATGQLLNGSSYDLGLTYTFGPAVVGIDYFNGHNKGLTTAGNNNGSDRVEGGAVTGRYQLGPGVNVEASVFHFNVRGNASTSGVDKNNATGLMTGLLLNF
ncbi:MAG TPA: porin [Alphaproteobacteria bacterium]|nr:porin [Alphaproteobacteria bacterium]